MPYTGPKTQWCFNTMKNCNCARCYTPVILAFGRLRPESLRVQVTLVHIGENSSQRRKKDGKAETLWQLSHTPAAYPPVLGITFMAFIWQMCYLLIASQSFYCFYFETWSCWVSKTAFETSVHLPWALEEMHAFSPSTSVFEINEISLCNYFFEAGSLCSPGCSGTCYID